MVHSGSSLVHERNGCAQTPFTCQLSDRMEAATGCFARALESDSNKPRSNYAVLSVTREWPEDDDVTHFPTCEIE
jgi:hypothetical protein